MLEPVLSDVRCNMYAACRQQLAAVLPLLINAWHAVEMYALCRMPASVIICGLWLMRLPALCAAL
jgi:hypothetical protein